ncbi:MULTISPECIES: hypothetical protein [Bartonella]|uniref:hypothetical protein n=1 Tax=Bartonella TaxID=773 RepID=UPI00235E782B|nr:MULTISPECIES: hypothetical protein [Bartonella]
MPFYEPFQEPRAVATLEAGKICNGLAVLSSVKAPTCSIHKHKNDEALWIYHYIIHEPPS